MVEIRVSFYVEYRPMPDCCMEAAFSAFIDAYPKADICLPGIDSNLLILFFCLKHQGYC